MFARVRWVRVTSLVMGLILLATVGVAAEGSAPRRLDLKASIELALGNNVLVKSAIAQRDSALARADEAKAATLPKLSASGSYTKLEQGVPYISLAPDGLGGFTPIMAVGPDTSTDLRLSITQPLYTGGALTAAVRSARAGLSGAEADLENRNQEIAVQVATAYYGVLAAERMLKVSEEALASAEAHLSVVKAAFDSGTVLKTDVLRTSVAVGQAKQNLIRARNARETATLSFLLLLGLPADTPLTLVEPGERPKAPPTFAEALQVAYAKRPDLASAKAQLAAAKAGVDQARAASRPSVTLIASEGYRGSGFDDLDGSWSVTLNASYNLYDWGQAKARATQAQEGVKALELRVKGLEDQIRLEVSQAFQAVHEADERLPLAQATLDQALENLNLTQVRYDAGLATTVDLLDSQVLVSQSETAHIQATYDCDLARVRLAKASGVANTIE